MNPDSLAESIRTARHLDLLQVLCRIAEKPTPISDLAVDLGISDAGITHIADKLEELRFAERRRSTDPLKDRRCVHLAITHHGADAFNEILSAGLALV